ncbi:MAG: P-loop NTPase, partial [Dehalococcoidia bacterium]|nr:P-loop NTPase [Dehalococcoidia bacterium]
GGVGKSTVTANLSATLAMRGNRVTILDQDLDGSSIPKMFDVMDQRMKMSEEGLLPVDGPLGIQVVATANLPKSEEGLVWFHDMRRNASEEFICHTLYGERDFLVVDLPPGTSSDNVTVIQLLSGADGYVIVTAPSGISQVTARKALLLARKGGMRILGVVENMSGYICEECGEPDDSLPVGGGLALASEQDVPFLGRVPLDPKLAKSCDSGVPLVQAFASSGTARMMDAIVDRVLAQLGDSRQRTFSESELLAPDRPADGPARRG